MRPRRSVEDWRREVLRSHRINDGTRVLLLILAERMRPNRHVSIPRAELAKLLDRAERRISERITAAHEAGFLGTVAAGYRGSTAVYQGLFPDAESGTHARPLSGLESGTPTSPLSSAETRPLSTQESGTHGGPTNRRANLPLSGTDRNVGSNEGHQGDDATSRPTACETHGWADCPDRECIDAEVRRRTA